MAKQPKKKLNLYRFVFCFESDCCDKPHLWAQAVHAATPEEGKQKALREVSNGNREVFEVIEVTNGFGTVEDIGRML